MDYIAVKSFHELGRQLAGPQLLFVDRELRDKFETSREHALPQSTILLRIQNGGPSCARITIWRGTTLQSKMANWMANGAHLAWLIDPYRRQVFVYRAGRPTERTTNRTLVGEGPVEGFVLDLVRVWKCYED